MMRSGRKIPLLCETESFTPREALVPRRFPDVLSLPCRQPQNVSRLFGGQGHEDASSHPRLCLDTVGLWMSPVVGVHRDLLPGRHYPGNASDPDRVLRSGHVWADHLPGGHSGAGNPTSIPGGPSVPLCRVPAKRLASGLGHALGNGTVPGDPRPGCLHSPGGGSHGPGIPGVRRGRPGEHDVLAGAGDVSGAFAALSAAGRRAGPGQGAPAHPQRGHVQYPGVLPGHVWSHLPHGDRPGGGQLRSGPGHLGVLVRREQSPGL